MKTFTQKLYIHEAQEWSLDEYYVASSDMTDNGFSGRIDHIQGLFTAGRDPVSIDVKLSIVVHRKNP